MTQEAPNTPTQHNSTDVTPSQAAAAASAQVVQSQQEAARAAYESSLDIRDPGQPNKGVQTTEGAGAQQQVVSGFPNATADGGYTTDLLGRAASVGIPADEARAIPVHILERQIQRLSQFEYDEPEQQYDPRQQPMTFQDFLTWQQQMAQQQGGTRPQQGPPQLDRETFEDPLRQAWDQNNQYWNQQIRARDQQLNQIQQQLQQQNQFLQARHNTEQFNTVENLIAGDKDFSDVLGSGPADALRGTPQYSARQRLANRMDSIHNEYINAGMAPPSANRVYEEARNSLFGSRAVQRVEGRVNDRLRDRSGQFIARPTASIKGDLPPGQEKAIQSAARFMQENKMGAYAA
jgi:hypothetical protein